MEVLANVRSFQGFPSALAVWVVVWDFCESDGTVSEPVAETEVVVGGVVEGASAVRGGRSKVSWGLRERKRVRGY